MKYKFSFTAVSLAPAEMQTLAALYPDYGSWPAVYDHAVVENTIRSRTASSLRRITLELVHRLARLSPEECRALVENRAGERAHIAWLACCRNYELIGDFAVEGLHEAFVNGQKTFTADDFERFVSAKVALHPELDARSPQTYAKVRQILFKMMHEAGFLEGKSNLVPVVLDPSFESLLADSDRLFYPMYVGAR